MHCDVHHCAVYNSQDTWMSNTRGMDKAYMVHVHSELYSAIKELSNAIAVTWMYLEIVIRSEEKRQIPHDSAYMWNLIKG